MEKKFDPVRIFVVEDDPMYQRMVKYIMELNPDHEVHLFNNGKACLKQLHLNPSIISLDYTLPDFTGEEILKKIKEFNSDIGVIILSGQQDVSTAVNLLKEGAYDYITKDTETKERLLNSLTNIKKHIALQNEVETLKTELQQTYSFEKSIVGNSKPMQRIFRLLEKAVKTNITVSVTGETGTGKEVIAKSIHYNSPKRKAPFIAVNMSAIPKELLESELFGYEKGAFTGANARKKGKFELADGGTLFLDEIAEMDINMQAKVLRAIQEREITRLGGEKPIKFDARIIVATHQNLADQIEKGNFREDLYYRLLGLPIHLPPLRERGNDIILLAQYFLKEFVKQNGMSPLEISKDAKKKLMAYSYPGNVRELKAIIDLAAVMSDGEQILAEDITFNGTKKAGSFLTQEMTFEEYKRNIIFHYLEKYDNDIILVAQKLDIGKSTIYRLLQNEKSQQRSMN